MKKLIALAIAILMIASMATMFSVADDPVLGVFGNGMEVWRNTVQLLLSPTPWDAEVYTTNVLWTITISGGDLTEAKTMKLFPSSIYNGGTWGICRFQPTLALHDTWTPAKDTEYNVSATCNVAGVEKTFAYATGTSVVAKTTDDPAATTGDKPVAVPTKLGGYIINDGFTIANAQYTFCYDFDIAGVDTTVYGDFKEDGTTPLYNFEIQVVEHDTATPVYAGPTTIVASNYYTDNDNAYFFSLGSFKPVNGTKYDVRVYIKTATSYTGSEYVEATNFECKNMFDMKALEDIGGELATVDAEGNDVASTIKWKIVAEEKALYVYGAGIMKDFASWTDTPWLAYSQSIEKVYVAGTVTKTAKNSFAHFAALTQICFGEGFTEISMDTMAYAGKDMAVYLPSTLAKVGQGATYGSSVGAVYFNGTKTAFQDLPFGAYNDTFVNSDGIANDIVVFSTAVPTFTPPTGDYTVIAIVLAVLALAGMAVVIKKVRV